jgi:hypothetical protein
MLDLLKTTTIPLPIRGHDPLRVFQNRTRIRTEYRARICPKIVRILSLPP